MKTLTILIILILGFILFLTHFFVKSNVLHSKNIQCNAVKGEFRDGVCYIN